MRSLGVRQQALELACEGLCVKDFILAPPDDQGRQLGLRQRCFEPNELRPARAKLSSGIHRGHAQVRIRAPLSNRTAS